jgi:hypothetical protein
MDMDDFFALFLKTREHELEQKTWELWLSLQPMREDNYISYEELLSGVKGEEPEGVYIDQAFI